MSLDSDKRKETKLIDYNGLHVSKTYLCSMSHMFVHLRCMLQGVFGVRKGTPAKGEVN